VIERLPWEIVSLANHVLVADAAGLADIEATHRSMRKAFQTLDIGLKYLSQEEPVKAARVLETVPIIRIFQTGFSLALRLKWTAESMVKRGWLAALDRGVDILDSPLEETVRALLRKRPLFFCAEGGGNERPFEKLEEVALVEERLERTSLLGKLVHENLGVSAEEINRVNGASCYHSDPTLSTICLTVVANKLLRGVKELEPIDRSSLNPSGPF
jgi:hypothetical protein